MRHYQRYGKPRMQRFQEQERNKWQVEKNWFERHRSKDMSSDITFGRSGFISLNQNHADESSNQAMKKKFDRRNRRKRRKVSCDIFLTIFRHSLL